MPQTTKRKPAVPPKRPRQGQPSAAAKGRGAKPASPAEPAAEYVLVSSLVPWKKNPKDHKPEAIARIAASITTFGFGAPVLARRHNNEIIAGHRRVKAAKQLGMTHVPVRFLDLDEEKAHILAIADNRLNEDTITDDALLAAAIADITAQNPLVDLLSTGYDNAQLAALMASEAKRSVPASPSSETRPSPKPGGGIPITGTSLIEHGDVAEVLSGYPANSFDAIVCDPPYGLKFMGKRWDYDVPSVALWLEVIRVLKPGGLIIAFGGTRTYHRLACAIEDAGFEIRDQLAWLYGSGFPKSHDVSKAIDEHHGLTQLRPVKGSYKATGTAARSPKGGGASSFMPSAADPTTSEIDPDARIYQTTGASPSSIPFDGYGTALKPAFEPAVLARKPLEGTIAENALKHGTGGLAIDASRIGTDGGGGNGYGALYNGLGTVDGATIPGCRHSSNETDILGRFPANVLLDPEAAAMLDEQSGIRPGMSGGGKHKTSSTPGMFGAIDGNDAHIRSDTGGASRFFYTAKANRRERTLGVEANPHPTVKPASLSRYLARLLLPPPPSPGSTTPRRLLVPFSGSGSEVIGGLLAGWDEVVGIEREAEYVQLARERIAYAMKNPDDFAEANDDE